MTKEQFARGWALLTIQPWGRLYRGQGPEATIQAELYYRHVDQANPVVWHAVCESAATGEAWPSLSTLKSLLQVNGGYQRDEQQALPAGARLPWEEAPWPLRACWTYQKDHGCSLRDAAMAVLPVWLAQHPTHEDAQLARQFLDQAKDNFRMPMRTGGNVQVPL